MPSPKKVFDAKLRSLTPLHRELNRRYEIVYHINDFVAGLLFVIGSVLFFWPAAVQAGTWLFLVGSILFTLRPAISLLRDLHLLRLPHADNQEQNQPVTARTGST